MFIGPFVGNGFANKDSGVGIHPSAPSGGETGIDQSRVCAVHVYHKCSQVGTSIVVYNTL